MAELSLLLSGHHSGCPSRFSASSPSLPECDLIEPVFQQTCMTTTTATATSTSSSTTRLPACWWTEGLRVSRGSAACLTVGLLSAGSCLAAYYFHASSEGPIHLEDGEVGESRETPFEELFCSRETGGSCHLLGHCWQWRGPTICEDGRCICAEGYCGSSAGTCMQRSRGVEAGAGNGQCEANTGGTCLTSQCAYWRGPTDCSYGQCRCRAGYCSDEHGGCYKDMGMIKAEVVPINSLQRYFPGTRVRTALCVSGGGSRAFSAAFGVYRALRELKLITSIDAISSVSGGTWASSILMFAEMDLEQLLGRPLGRNPRVLYPNELDKMPAPFGAIITTYINPILLGLKISGVPLSMLWVAAVAEAYLEPFGLNHLDAYMAGSQREIDAIKQKNPQFNDAKFQVPQPGRAKTIIMNSIIMAPPNFEATADTVVNLQISPDYSGSPFYPNGGTVNYHSVQRFGGRDLDNYLVGGGVISTYAFGSAEPTNPGRDGQMGGQNVEMHSGPRPMCLARAVGWSSAAFGAALTAIPGIGTGVNPRVEMWPITSEQQPRPQQAARMMIGDGGSLENLGINAALQRGASKIVSCYGTVKPLQSTMRYCSNPNYDPTGMELSQQLGSLFGFATFSESKSDYPQHNQVFPRFEYRPFLCELQKLQDEGRPLVVRRQLTTVTNAWWGIEGDRQVDIAFVILGRSRRFEETLPAETQSAIEGQVGLKHWPHFKTMFQNTVDITQYTPRQINLLSTLMEWAVYQNEDMIREVLR